LYFIKFFIIFPPRPKQYAQPRPYKGMKINKKFKDSVFTTLFSDPDLLRELYCALGGVTLAPDVPVSINTLKKALVMDLYNDISFEIGGKLVVLIEHQSTINPNIALRLLLYIAEVLKKMVKNSTIYSSKPLPIPWPEFYVLYNGTSPFPDEKTLHLSDLFENPQDLGIPKNAHPFLELEVRVININEGKNLEIVNRCSKLAEYSQFMAKARACWEKHGDLTKGVEEAIKYCHKHGILKEYLEIHGAEVFNMLYTEWNWDDAMAVLKEETREESYKEIARNALQKGYSLDSVHEITGLDLKTIQRLNNE